MSDYWCINYIVLFRIIFFENFNCYAVYSELIPHSWVLCFRFPIHVPSPHYHGAWAQAPSPVGHSVMFKKQYYCLHSIINCTNNITII